MNGWIGVDLDGTLAHYDVWRGPTHIGEPVPEMRERVVRWLSVGTDVRIFTARVSIREGEELARVRVAIEAWCLKYLGVVLPITCTKDYGMIELWDDRVVQVEENTGRMYGPSRTWHE